MAPLLLKLFVAGDTPRSREARASLARICAELADGEARVEVVDVLERPEVAEGYRVLTTPTVVREAPPPRRRVTGDLADRARVADALGLFTSNHAS